MAFVAQCTYCGQKGRVHAGSFGESVECPRCHNWYTAAPADDLPAPRAPVAIAPALGLTAPAPAGESRIRPAPATPPSTADPAPAATSPTTKTLPKVPTPPIRRRLPHRWIHQGGLAACLLGSLALVAASQPWFSFLTIPMSALGSAVGIGAIIHACNGRWLRRVLPIAGTLASILVLLTATVAPGMLGPVFETNRQASGFSSSAMLVIPLQIGSKEAQPEIDGWADASRAVVHQDRVRVQIAAVAVGPVQFAVPKGTSKESYVAVSLVVQHLGHGQSVAFTHWGAAGVKQTPSPVLTQGDRKLAYHQVETEVVTSQVRQGHTLYPGKAVEDLLLFEGSITQREPLRLELPADAWGGRGVVKFHLPASMIQQRPTKTK